MEDMDEVNTLRVGLVQNAAEQTITLRHTNKESAVPIRQYGAFHPGTGTGGASEAWGGIATAFYRSISFLLHIFAKSSALHGSPPNCTVKDWGITYDQFENYYWRAEQLMGVSGKAGNLNGKLIPGGNIFEGPRKQSFQCLLSRRLTPWASSPRPRRRWVIILIPCPPPSLSQNYTNPDGVSRPGCMYCGYCPNMAAWWAPKRSPRPS